MECPNILQYIFSLVSVKKNCALSFELIIVRRSHSIIVLILHAKTRLPFQPLRFSWRIFFSALQIQLVMSFVRSARHVEHKVYALQLLPRVQIHRILHINAHEQICSILIQ